MSDIVILDPTDNEIREALEPHYSVWIEIAGPTALSALGVIGIYLYDSSRASWIVLSVTVAMLALRVFYRWLTRGKRFEKVVRSEIEFWQQQAKRHGSVSCRFDDEVIMLHQGSKHERFAWRDAKHWTETTHAFRIGQLIIPKRQLDSSQLAQVRNRLPPPSARNWIAQFFGFA